MPFCRPEETEIRYHRELLAILFAALALVLSVHQASAACHEGKSTTDVVNAEPHGVQNSQDAFHSVGCCSASVGVGAAEFYGIFYAASQIYSLDGGGDAVYPHTQSKHFRPPRPV